MQLSVYMYTVIRTCWVMWLANGSGHETLVANLLLYSSYKYTDHISDETILLSWETIHH